MRTILSLSLVSLSLLTLSGCATTKYQCPMPSGLACVSAADVYKATNAPGKAGMDVTGADIGKSGRMGSARGRAAAAPTGGTSGGVVTPLPKPGDVVPIREQARVMRIWIAPWVDSAGNLTMASRVYSEIEPKRWSVGEPTGDHSTNFYPLQVDADSPAPASASQSPAVTPGSPIAMPGTESAPVGAQ